MKRPFWLMLVIILCCTLFFTACNMISPAENYSLTITKEGQGIIEPSKGIHTFQAASIQTITVDPKEGWHFLQWGGSNGHEVLRTEKADNEYQIYIDETKEITAYFSKEINDTVTLDLKIEGQGKVFPEQSTFEGNSTVTLEVVPQTNWVFTKWQGPDAKDVVAKENEERFFQIVMNEDKELIAFFQSSIISVPTDYPTIQKAIDNADDGYTIIVDPGEYSENIDFLGKAISLRSTDPYCGDCIETTIIRGQSNAAVVTFQSGETSAAQLWGFTITSGMGGSNDVGGGILINNSSSPIINGNIIKHNQAQYGGGIAVGNNSSPQIINNTIEHNQANSKRGAGLYIFNNSEANVQNNIFQNHTGGDGVIHVGSVYSDESEIIMINNLVRNNITDFGVGGLSITAESKGFIAENHFESNTGSGDNGAGAIAVINGSEATIVNNSFHDNKGNRRGAVYVYNHSQAIISDNTFTNNEAGISMEGHGIGGAILASYHVKVEIKNNTFYRNHAHSNTHGGGAIAIYSWGQETEAKIVGNTINSNRAIRRGAGIYVTGSATDVKISTNFIFSNRVSEHQQARGGGIYIGNVKRAEVFANTIINNYAQQYGGGIFIHRDAKMRGPLDTFWSPINYPPFREPFNLYFFNDHEGNGYGPIGKHVFVDS